MATLDELKEIRLSKLKKIKDLGINPYTARSKKDYTNLEIKNKFSTLEGKNSFVTGRIVSIRSHGKITFFDIEDDTSRLQLFFSEKGTSNFSHLELFDLGDFIEAFGVIFKTKSGEITIDVKSFKILTKSLRPLPSEYFGIQDEEEKIRKRYVDLISNKDLKEKLRLKSKFIQSSRDFLISEGFLEVDTPTLELILGGAEAEPFITHHNSLDQDLYLRIALELPLKRLIVAGFDKIFEIGKVFRNEGMSMQHLQEFNMLEFYWAYSDYEKLMDFTENMYIHILKETFGTTKINYKGEEVDFKSPWPRLKYFDLMKEYGCNLEEFDTREKLRQKAIEIGLSDNPTDDKNRLIDRIYKKLVRPNIKGPIFLIDHPVDISPLAKRHEDDSRIVERFQVLVLGFEVGNAFSELNDSQDQYERFKEQQRLRDEGDLEAQMMDEDFIEALEYGMPPTGGFGVGLDRLFMIAAGLSNIRETEYFPIIKKI
jgi:lysyl-tRNA synthetase class 2